MASGAAKGRTSASVFAPTHPPSGRKQGGARAPEALGGRLGGVCRGLLAFWPGAVGHHGGRILKFSADPTRRRLVRTVTSGVVRSPSALKQAAGELLKPWVGYLAVRARARRSGRGQFATVGVDPESFSTIR